MTLKGSDGSLVKTSWRRSRTDQGGPAEDAGSQLTGGGVVFGWTSPRATASCTRRGGLRPIARRVGTPGWAPSWPPGSTAPVGADQGYFGVRNRARRGRLPRRRAPPRRHVAAQRLRPPPAVGFGGRKAGEAKACARVLGADRCWADAEVRRASPSASPPVPVAAAGTGRNAPPAYLFLPRLTDQQGAGGPVGSSRETHLHHRGLDGRRPAGQVPETLATGTSGGRG